MTQPYANVDGAPLLSADVHVPGTGPWWATVTYEGDPVSLNRVTLRVGDLELVGTVTEDGVFGLQRRSKIVGGGAGWATLLSPVHYHSDSGVAARTVAAEAAAAAGERLGAFVPAETFVGNAYMRRAGPASRVLEDVIGGVPWYVDYSGLTVVDERQIVDVPPAAVEVMGYDPREGLLTLAADELARVPVGARIVAPGLEAPVVVSELWVVVREGEVRLRAWTGGELGGRGRLAKAFRSIARRSLEDVRLFGKYRYRVVRLSGERVELQAVARAAGVADAAPVSMWAGVAGAHAKLQLGSQVLVEFVEGSPTMPLITAFIGRDQGGPAHAADELDLSVATLLRLGSQNADAPVALAAGIDRQLDDLNEAIDVFVRVPLNGTLADAASLQNGVKAVWGAGEVRPPSDVAAKKVVAE